MEARRSAVRQWISHHAVSAFLVVLYPVTWVLYLPEILGKSGVGIIPVDIPAQVGVFLSTIFALTGGRGSLPVVALMHASIDTTASTAVLTAFYPGVDGRWLYVAIGVVAAVVAVGTRGRLGYRPPRTMPARRLASVRAPRWPGT